MILSTPRKRSRDIEDDFDLTAQPLGKRSKGSAGDAYAPASAITSQWNFMQTPPEHSRLAEHSEDDSIASNVSETGSPTDDSMDLDSATDTRLWSPHSTGQLTPTTLLSRSSWDSPSAVPFDQRTPRKSDSLLIRPIRPKPSPLQSAAARSSTSFRPHRPDATTPRSILNPIATDRLPSPIDEDEPHTPTTAAGSQLSMLSVNDMDIDSDSAAAGTLTPLAAEAAGSGGGAGSFIRKQRQRSGAFISSPDVAKRFQMGYREDCERCRNRVPGHMNHFVGT